MPAWLTEGLSGYYEYDLALSGPRPNATQLRVFKAADEARAAAQAGGLFSFATLESQSDWNTRTDEGQVSLKYAEAYMAVRSLNETYGPQSAKWVVEDIGLGFGLPQAIKTVTGLDLAVFESQFNRCLGNWEDPARASIAEYLTAMDVLLAERDAIIEERSKNNADTTKRANESAIKLAVIVDSTKALVENLQILSPPEGAVTLHQEAGEYFGRVLDWLTLEFEYSNSLYDPKRVAANAMIPEINAREFLLERNMSNLQFILHLRE